jgi:hypothetical protein
MSDWIGCQKRDEVMRSILLIACILMSWNAVAAPGPTEDQIKDHITKNTANYSRGSKICHEDLRAGSDRLFILEQGTLETVKSLQAVEASDNQVYEPILQETHLAIEKITGMASGGDSDEMLATCTTLLVAVVMDYHDSTELLNASPDADEFSETRVALLKNYLGFLTTIQKDLSKDIDKVLQ